MTQERWIFKDDDVLLASIMKHEGTKQLIYQYIESGQVKVAEGCNFVECKANDLWPAYLDTQGLETVGIGHLITNSEAYNSRAGVNDNDVIKQLANDIATHLSAAKSLAAAHGMNIDRNYVVQRFMTEMCFNIGANRYSKFKSGLLKLASAVEKNGDFSYSKWARQVKERANSMVDTLRALDP
jgi:GH24 family phage-related lysozyme (muramidase)